MTGITHGLWRVTGGRAYRGHEPGVEFEAGLANGPAWRAVARGDIQLLEAYVPEPPANRCLPEGWIE